MPPIRVGIGGFAVHESLHTYVVVFDRILVLTQVCGMAALAATLEAALVRLNEAANRDPAPLTIGAIQGSGFGFATTRNHLRTLIEWTRLHPVPA